MSSMTAEQVWALVKDWPREAWPVMSVSFRNESVVCGSSVELVDGLRIPTPIAAHAFVGSGLAWLVNEGHMPEVYRCAEGRGIRGGVVRETMAEEETLLQAVSSAVLAASDERGGA